MGGGDEGRGDGGREGGEGRGGRELGRWGWRWDGIRGTPSGERKRGGGDELRGRKMRGEMRWKA